MKDAVPSQNPVDTERVVAWFNMFLQMGLILGPLVGTGLVNKVGWECMIAITGSVISAYGAFAMRFVFSSCRASHATPGTPPPSPNSPVRRIRSGSISGTYASPTRANQTHLDAF